MTTNKDELEYCKTRHHLALNSLNNCLVFLLMLFFSPVVGENWPHFSRAINEKANWLLGCVTAINLHSSYSISSCFDSPVIDLTVIAAHNITTLRPLSFAFQPPHPPHPQFSFALSCLRRPPPCWGDLPCLLTDNSDRKLLHVITLLKSQFTQPQQIILRWVPGVMETVFSTLHPASPAPPKPRRSFAAAAREQLPFLHPPPQTPTHTSSFSPRLHFVFLPLFYPWSLLGFSNWRTPACLLRMALSAAKLDIIQVTGGVY